MRRTRDEASPGHKSQKVSKVHEEHTSLHEMKPRVKFKSSKHSPKIKRGNY